VTALETTGEVVVAIVVAIVVATARCTRVATSTQIKPELNNSPFTKRQLFPLQRTALAAAAHQPIKIYPFKIIPT
jgi:hypothetical protein